MYERYTEEGQHLIYQNLDEFRDICKQLFKSNQDVMSVTWTAEMANKEKLN